MGASNALRAYERYASVVPPMSMVVLAYMALVAKDSDDWPWFGLGQHAIAEFAMGRPDPDESDLRAVRRALTPLARAGAITVDRAGAGRSGGNSTARYRLNLHVRADAARTAWTASTPDGKRPVSRAVTPDGKRPIEDPRHRTENVPKTGRFVVEDRTVCDRTPDEFRPPKEEEEPRGAKEEGKVDLETASHPPRVPAPGTGNVIPFVSKKPDPDLERRTRSRVAGVAALAASAEKVRTRAADIQARIDARKETS